MKNKIYDPYVDPNSAESKVVAYRERARKLLNKEHGDSGAYFTSEITITAQMLQTEENTK